MIFINSPHQGHLDKFTASCNEAAPNKYRFHIPSLLEKNFSRGIGRAKGCWLLYSCLATLREPCTVSVPVLKCTQDHVQASWQTKVP